MRWCEVCRQPLIRRAALWARGIALLLTLLLGIWIAFAIGPSSRFLVAWMAILAVTYLVITRIAQRIAFEVIRARAISTAEE